MRRQCVVTCVLALVLTVSGCASSAPKDSAPVPAPAPTVSPTPSASPSTGPEPTETVTEQTSPPDAAPPRSDGSADPGDGASEVPDDLKEMLVPEDLVGLTADDLYGAGVNDLMADVEAGDKRRRVGVCRTAAIIVSELTRAEIDERRAGMEPADVEVLTDFISLCGRVLES